MGDTYTYYLLDGGDVIGIDNIVTFFYNAEAGVSNAADLIQKAFGGGSSSPGDPNWGKGFKTFDQLKRYLGSPGEGNEWHHIVEQCQTKEVDLT